MVGRFPCLGQRFLRLSRKGCGREKMSTLLPRSIHGVGQLLQNGSGQPVPVQSQSLQVRQGGQRGQQQEEGLVRQICEAQLQAAQDGRVALEVCTQTLHVPSSQRNTGQIQRPAGQRGRLRFPLEQTMSPPLRVGAEMVGQLTTNLLHRPERVALLWTCRDTKYQHSYNQSINQKNARVECNALNRL
ncbi:hypothetical protein F7725_020208, partial [Dissostichus mawsoni]